MYRGYNVSLPDDDMDDYRADGIDDHVLVKNRVSSAIASFQNSDGSLDAARLTAEWFPKIDRDVFISHAHKDSELAVGLAGFLKYEFGITSFIDSAAWGYAEDLLRLIDDAYCLQPSGTYNYSKRNRSTSHVHMMLSTALAGMLDHCECVMFLAAQVTAAVDLSDILRAEIVMAVSAFDYYVHELCRLGILESHNGTRPRTDAMARFQVPMSALPNLANAATAEQALNAIVREKHGYQSFQKPESVADAVRLFSAVSLWNAIAAECGETPKAAKSAFQLIIDRRNQIAHEADLDPSFPDQRWPIDVALVEDAFARIEKVANAIFTVAA